MTGILVVQHQPGYVPPAEYEFSHTSLRPADYSDIGQAKVLAAGAETEFARRAKAGVVETSRDDGTAGQDNIAEIVENKAETERPKS